MLAPRRFGLLNLMYAFVEANGLLGLLCGGVVLKFSSEVYYQNKEKKTHTHKQRMFTGNFLMMIPFSAMQKQQITN